MSRRVSLRIHYDRRPGLVALLAYLAWGQRETVASNLRAPLAMSTSMRQYYLTKNFYQGGEPLTTCANGYHTASLWEILDPSHLKHNTNLGGTRADSGQGPPRSAGWVRTGYNSFSSSPSGQANCNTWTSSSGSDAWTYTILPNNWTAGNEDVHVWGVDSSICSSSRHVWCVEDTILYLPLILRNYRPQ